MESTVNRLFPSHRLLRCEPLYCYLETPNTPVTPGHDELLGMTCEMQGEIELQQEVPCNSRGAEAWAEAHITPEYISKCIDTNQQRTDESILLSSNYKSWYMTGLSTNYLRPQTPLKHLESLCFHDAISVGEKYVNTNMTCHGSYRCGVRGETVVGTVWVMVSQHRGSSCCCCDSWSTNMTLGWSISGCFQHNIFFV